MSQITQLVASLIGGGIIAAVLGGVGGMLWLLMGRERNLAGSRHRLGCGAL